MTAAIEIAKRCGIAYYLTPDNTCEMHGTDRQIEAFAEAIRTAERDECARVCRRRADILAAKADQIASEDFDEASLLSSTSWQLTLAENEIVKRSNV